jgi:steroid 5-alpha reductase family enzyme
MNSSSSKGLLVLIIVILIGVGLALAGSQHGAQAFGSPLFALAVGLIFIIQWLVFIPAFTFQTEKYFDITGSLTYIGITLLAVLLSPKPDARSILLAVLVIIWAGRLGTFLYRRIHRAGKDDRFDEIKPNLVRFLNTWTLQGLWIAFTLSAALAAITSTTRKELDLFALFGAMIWIIGLTIEATADAQKNRFRADPTNQGKFIKTGLWSRSRHPNYFGEILLWIGVAVITLPILQGWQWVTLISPVFVTLLLTRVSGIPMLEKKADAKWGGQTEYEEYKKNTPALIPRV